jgi:hypothetical protein
MKILVSRIGNALEVRYRNQQFVVPAGDPDKTAVGEITTATKETRFITNVTHNTKVSLVNFMKGFVRFGSCNKDISMANYVVESKL